VSYAVDANILLYASDRGSPRHAAALAFLQARPADPDIFCLAWITLMAYLRVATHPRIFAQPLSPAEALANVGGLLGLPRARVLSEGEGFLEVYGQLTDGMAVRGNLVPDAHLAALLRQHGVRTLYTADADFRRFRFLDVRDPFV
jgi:toxin-antitoxin system PIN domain toxin